MKSMTLVRSCNIFPHGATGNPNVKTHDGLKKKVRLPPRPSVVSFAHIFFLILVSRFFFFTFPTYFLPFLVQPSLSHFFLQEETNLLFIILSTSISNLIKKLYNPKTRGMIIFSAKRLHGWAGKWTE